MKNQRYEEIKDEKVEIVQIGFMARTEAEKTLI